MVEPKHGFVSVLSQFQLCGHFNTISTFTGTVYVIIGVRLFFRHAVPTPLQDGFVDDS